jgi:hypothetical protein
VVAAAIVLSINKLSLFCSVIIGIATNYINFFAFSKIIEIRNAGIFDAMAADANISG